MRYYLYISDTKLDMLRAQIPVNKLKAIAAGLKIDLKLLSVSLERKSASDDAFAKLRAVEKYLEDNDEIGTESEPRSYFRGTTLLKSGIMKETNAQFAYFGGRSSGRSIALIGSPHHLIGGTARMNDIQSEAAQGYLLPVILRCLRGNVTIDSEEAETRLNNLSAIGYLIDLINQDTNSPAQPIEYLAKRLSMGNDYILATPLYVALAD